ncbi:MAG: DUF4340 domain-containing protein [Candidatus Latescibacterota bacterium]|nr:DUF4340 domain-containing protein [Candidatus Latescibacterota bacterium]
MRLKTNLVISVIFAGLLGFVYFYEIKGGEERKEQAEQALQLLKFSDHEVAEIRIQRADTLLVLQFDEGHWRITSPVDADADADAVERYLRNLRDTDLEDRDPVLDSAAVADDASRLAQYGIDDPRVEVHLGMTEGADSVDTLRFGNDSPTERFTYLQRSGGNPAVLKVRAWQFDNLDKGVFDLRDRRLIAFDKEDVREIRLRGENRDVVVARMSSSDEWQLRSPLRTGANETTMNSILSRLSSATVVEFIHESPDVEKISESGLADGAAFLRISLLLGEDRAEKHLLLGNETTHGDRLARDTSRPHVFVVDSTVVDVVDMPVAEFRNKRAFRLQKEDVAQIELERAGEGEVFVAILDTVGDWSLSSHPDRKAKAWRLNSMITDIDDIEVEAFVLDVDSGDDVDLGRYGFDDPRVRVRISHRDGDDRILLVGDEGQTGPYVTTAGGTSVFEVLGSQVEELELSLSDVAQEPTSTDTLSSDGS